MSLSSAASDSPTSEDGSVLPPVLNPEIQRALEQNPFAAESSYFTRPNRFFGSASTWRSWTAQDRAITDALRQLRTSELSAHLYNAYALKRRTQSYQEPPGIGSEGGDGEIPADETTVEHQDNKLFSPPKVWTAWPMPSDQVPRKDQEYRIEASKFRRKSEKRASAGLEEALVAYMLKSAKDRWNERFWQKETSSTDLIITERDWKAEKEATERWKSSNPVSPRDDDRDRTESEDDGITSKLSSSLQSPKGNTFGNPDLFNADSPSSSSQALQDPETPITFSSQAFVNATSPDSDAVASNNAEVDRRNGDRPTFIADDERAHKLLTPSARHILSKLDDLLSGLHKARKVYATGRYPKDSRSTSIASGEQSASNDSASPVKDAQIESARGRKRKRVASILENEETAGYSQSRSRSRRDKLTAGGFGLRDWSDVLGMAALTGWDAEVVARASERCARLFNENMMFRTFHEGNSKADQPSHFSEEFALAEDISATETNTSEEEQKEISFFRISEPCARCRRRKKRCDPPAHPSIYTKNTILPITLPCHNCEAANLAEECTGITCKPMTPQVSVDSGLALVCPFPSCERHKLPFPKRYNLERHIEEVHHSHGEHLPSPERNLSCSMVAEISKVDADAQNTRTCPVKGCSRIFKRATRLYNHIRTMHPEVNADQFKRLKIWRTSTRISRIRSSKSRSRSTSNRRNEDEMMDSSGEEYGESTAEKDEDVNDFGSEVSSDTEAESGQRISESEHMTLYQDEEKDRFEENSDVEEGRGSEEDDG